MLEFVVGLFAEIADFVIDLWTDKILKKVTERKKGKRSSVQDEKMRKEAAGFRMQEG